MSATAPETPSTIEIPPDPGTYHEWLAARGITDVVRQAPDRRWALSSEWQRETAAHHRAVADAYVDGVRARHEPTMPPGVFDLLLGLVDHADDAHESRYDGCYPRVPDDCRLNCYGCHLVRPVADDVLRAARARRDGVLR